MSGSFADAIAELENSIVAIGGGGRSTTSGVVWRPGGDRNNALRPSPSREHQDHSRRKIASAHVGSGAMRQPISLCLALTRIS